MEPESVNNTKLTSETLEDLVLTGTVSDLVAAFEPLTEKERKSLSKTATKLYKAIRRRGLGQALSDELKGLLKRMKTGESQSLYANSQLTLLAVCPLSVVSKMDIWFMKPHEQRALVEILQDRRPAWLDQWIERRLDRDFPGISWDSLQTLIKRGACTRPRSDGYIRLMASHFSAWHNPKEQPFVPMSQRLLEEPEILAEDVFRLFEVETVAFTSTSFENYKGAPAGYESWITALGKLADAGHIDRKRLLDASLRAMTSGHKENLLSGFRKMHERLAPKLDEIKARESDYRALLGIRVGHVAAFGLKMMSRLEKAKQLDVGAFLDAARAVFDLSSKGPAKAVLKIVKRQINGDAGLAQPLARLAFRALRHEASDVQEMSIEILERISEVAGGLEVEEMPVAVEALSPSLRKRAQSLLGLDPADEVDSDHRDTSWFDALWDRFDRLPPEAAPKVGLDRTTLFKAFPAPLDYDILDVSMLSGIEPIVPIATVDELIEVVLHAVEVVESADEVERILDGLSRLCDKKADDFGLHTASLLHRLQNREWTETIRGLTSGWGGVSLALTDLLLTWVTGTYHDSKKPAFSRTSPAFLFVKRRIEELKEHVLKQDAGPLLAAPTHQHGWIDPHVFVDKLSTMKEDVIQTRREDFTQALLRLAPDGRPTALEQARAISGKAGRIVRWALGEGEGPCASDKSDYELWIAAGRARSPRESLRKPFDVFSHLDDLPDGLDPASYTWQSTTRTTTAYDKRTYTLPHLSISHGHQQLSESRENRNDGASLEALKTKARTLFMAVRRLASAPLRPGWRQIPTAALHVRNKHSWYSGDLNGVWLIHWMHYIWPLNTDSSVVAGMQNMILRIDENATAYIPNFAYLEPAFESNRSWTEMMHLALWMGLVSKDNELQGSAIDAMIEGIEDGRGHPRPMGAVLVQLAAGGWIKLNRLAQGLKSVAQVSHLHGFVVCEILENFVVKLESLPGNLHHILQLLLELHVLLGKGACEDFRTCLKTFKGHSKTAKLARQLSALERTGDLTEIYASAVERRISRAEGWVSRPGVDRV